MILEKNIEELQLNNKIINKLKEKDIRIIKDLWKMKRKTNNRKIKILGEYKNSPFSWYNVREVFYG